MRLVARILTCLGIVFFAVRTGHAGNVSGTINGTYQKSTREATTAGTDSIVSPESWTESKQSNLLINYQDVLFYKNMMRLGANYSVRRDEIAHDWIVRPIYNFDLRSDGYAYSSSYSPRTQTSRVRFPDHVVETRTRFREWRNSLTLSYSKLPVVNFSYNVTRAFDDLAERKADRKNRYLTVQSSYTTGQASANFIYSNSRNENRVSTPYTVDKYRTWQGTAGFSGVLQKIGAYSASYSYLDSRAGREAIRPGPISTSNIHSVAAMVSSREIYKLTSTASYSGRFQASHSADISNHASDENFSGQLSFTPLTYLSFSVTKNYQIASQLGRHRISENLAFSASVSRFLRRGLDTRLNWSRTYIQKSEISEDPESLTETTKRISSSDNYTDAYYASFAATPYRKSKLLADLSVARANRPGTPEQRYLSSRSLSLSFSATRSIEGRLSASFTNRGESFDLFKSYARIITAGATYTSKSNLNCNVAYSRNDINSAPHQTNSLISGYIGYSFRSAYTLYLNANQQTQDNPASGSPNARMIRKPRSVSAQLQVRLSPRSTLTTSYTRSSDAAAAKGRGGTHSVQVVYHGQF